MQLWSIGVDYDMQRIVISIRGTLSMKVTHADNGRDQHADTSFAEHHDINYDPHMGQFHQDGNFRF